jgi:DME family drug/metabolite transporter
MPTTVLHMRSRNLVVLAAVCFATTGTAQQLGPDGSSPLGVATFRFFIGSIALYFLSVLRPAHQPVSNRQSLAAWVWIATAFGQALYGAAFFSAVRSTGVAVGTVVALGSAPLITGAITAISSRKAPSLSWLVTTVFAIIGMSLIVASGKESQVTVSGVVLALCAGLGYAIFALGSKTILSSGVSSELAMAKVFGISSVMLAPTLFFVNLKWITSGDAIVMVLWLGFVTLALAYWSYAAGLRHLEPSQTTLITLVEPVVATVLGVLALNERPSTVAWIGVLIVIASLLAESRAPSKNMRH